MQLDNHSELIMRNIFHDCSNPLTALLTISQCGPGSEKETGEIFTKTISALSGLLKIYYCAYSNTLPVFSLKCAFTDFCASRGVSLKKLDIDHADAAMLQKIATLMLGIIDNGCRNSQLSIHQVNASQANINIENKNTDIIHSIKKKITDHQNNVRYNHISILKYNTSITFRQSNDNTIMVMMSNNK